MTATPVVLVGVYYCTHHFTPLPQDIQTPAASATQPKTQATPFRRRPPPEAQSQSLPGANLRKRVYLDTTPSYGPFSHPVAKATHMDQQTGTTRQILLPPRR